MNYTAEDLKNTKIRIESPEHSKYVQELAFSLGFSWMGGTKEAQYIHANFLYFYGDFDIAYGTHKGESAFNKHKFKEIKIPMPEQETPTPDEEREWPQVGDNVEFKPNPSIDSWIKAKVLFIGNKHTILKSHCGREYSRRNAKLILREPKTPKQELFDELAAFISEASYLPPEIQAIRIIEGFNITKKVDE